MRPWWAEEASFKNMKKIFSSKNVWPVEYLYIVYQQFPENNHEKERSNLLWTHTPEVVSAISLTKTTARNEADPSVLQKFHAVEHVWSLTLRLYSHTQQAMNQVN